MLAVSGRFQIEDGQPPSGKSQKQVGNAGQDNAGGGVNKAEDIMVWSWQGRCVSPSACDPWRKVADFLIRGQDGTLGKAVYAAENARHNRPWGLPAQLGSHPEASLATVRQGENTEIFGGDTHGGQRAALVL